MGEDSEMNNKPVAWLVDNQAYTIKEAAESLSRILESPAIPLYTHSVKELTDEEINELYMEHGNKDWDWQIDFAKAILKKAQEK